LVGVIIGVLSVLAIAAYGQYASAQVASVLAQFGSNLVAVSPAPPMTRSARLGQVQTLTTDDAAVIRQEVAHLLAVSGVKSGSVSATAGRYNWNTQVVGVSADFPLIQGLRVQAGGFVTAVDEQSTAAVGVLGIHAAAQLFPGIEPVGQTVRLNGNDFRVIGVLAARGRSMYGDLDDVIYVPLSTSLRRLYGGTSLDRIETRVDSSANIGGCIRAMTALLHEKHHIQPGHPEDFRVQNYQQLADGAKQTTDAISRGLSAAAVLALGIAGFGVMNIMLVSVEERTPEIGIRLAVGARGRDVRAQFLAEAATLCLGGSTIGWVVGLVGAEVVSQRIGVGVIPPVSAFLVSGITCVAIGLLFGLYPAERAARLDPIVALRSE
jgi:putative ABC transport system permease protein